MNMRAFGLALLMVVACGGTVTVPGGDAGIGGANQGGAAGAGVAGKTGIGGMAGATGGGGAAGNAGVAGSTGTGGSVDWSACDGPGQCVAVQTSCCPPCGFPDISTFVGVNQQYTTAYRSQQCPVALPCAACATIENPYVAARCVQGRCEVFDVQKVPEYSACQSVSDCVLRAGLACCECGAMTWVAVSQSGRSALADVLCAANSACPECQPVPPKSTVLQCNNNACNMTYLIP
jgi:hypothetical protein